MRTARPRRLTLRYLPLFLDLVARPVLVVGGGAIAERKVRLLREAGADVHVLSPRLTTALQRLADRGQIRHRAESFDAARADCLTPASGIRLIVAATDDRSVNAAVAAAAEKAGIAVNVVDDAVASTAILPAIVDRSPLIVAISTGGAAPMLARHVRERLETMLDESLGPLAALLARWRSTLTHRLRDAGLRRRFYSQLLRGELPQLVRSGRQAEAEAALHDLLRSTEHSLARERGDGDRNPPGHGDSKRDDGTPAGRDHTIRSVVRLVGAGPGDPGLMTLRALRALQEADVVLHDRLVTPAILALARRDAQLIDVGKEAGGESMPQNAIHALLLEHARAGRDVVRLKGGDPFVFGRGGEELRFLRAHGIAVEVVPGITAALGAAAEHAIPLTLRGVCTGLRLLSAQRGAEGIEPDWAAHAASADTLAIYMGLSQAGALGQTLQRHGRPAATPVALIAGATRADGRLVRGTLARLGELAGDAALRSPVLLIVGEVAAAAVLSPELREAV
jgi:uroporphyrin-III C-methyltransferase / precorrin-2 dehydrogenase / sirohydrochlorin ferrochelatase